MNFESLFVTIIFIIPGFIISGVRNVFNIRDNINTLDRTIQSVILSLALYSIISLVGGVRDIISPFFNIGFNNKNYNLLDFKILVGIWAIVLLSIFIGLAIGKATKSKYLQKVYFKVIGRTPYRTVWNEINETILAGNSRYVIIKIKGIDTKYLGWVDKATDYESSRELFLTDIYEIKRNENGEDEKFPLTIKGILVKYDNIDFIQILTSEEELKEHGLQCMEQNILNNQNKGEKVTI